MKKSKIIKIGSVGIDSGQLLLIDPCYIDSFWQKGSDENKIDAIKDHAHDIFEHKASKTLWQFTHHEPNATSYDDVKPFPGTYADVIPEFGKSPNELIKSGEFVKSKRNPTPQIGEDEFSYRAVCKKSGNGYGAAFDYPTRSDGLAVVARTGYGDGSYDVMAEIVDGYVKRIWVDFI